MFTSYILFLLRFWVFGMSCSRYYTIKSQSVELQYLIFEKSNKDENEKKS